MSRNAGPPSVHTGDPPRLDHTPGNHSDVGGNGVGNRAPAHPAHTYDPASPDSTSDPDYGQTFHAKW